MKKIILWAFALLAVSATTVAQNNTFHMVITLTNGTTIALGPNEISHLTFNEGEVTVDGQALDIFMQQKAKTDSLSMVTSNLEYALKANLAKVMDTINNLQAHLTALEARIADLNNSGGSGSDSEAIQAMKARIDKLENDLAGVEKDMITRVMDLEAAMKADKAAQQAETAQLESEIKGLTKSLAVQEMQAKASDDELRQQIKELYDRLMALEAAVAELRN